MVSSNPISGSLPINREEIEEILTKQIEKLTNYNQRKINLNSRVKKLD